MRKPAARWADEILRRKKSADSADSWRRSSEFSEESEISLTEAIKVVAKAIFNSEYERLKVKDAFTLFDAKFSGFNNLLADLIEEGILIKNNFQFAENSYEYVVFSYQRLGDFYIVEEMLRPYDTYEKLQKGFESDPNLVKIKLDKWQYDGLFEAMSVIIPEKYNHELYELSDFLIDKSISYQSHGISETEHLYRFADLLAHSLKWRSTESIDAEKITTWIDANLYIDLDTWVFTLAELSSIPNHPFNSDYLHQWLSNLSMPIRDSFLQRHLQYYNGYNNYNIAFPIRRLIDWAWSPAVSQNANTEVVRLTAQTLAWVLSSTSCRYE